MWWLLPFFLMQSSSNKTVTKIHPLGKGGKMIIIKARDRTNTATWGECYRLDNEEKDVAVSESAICKIETVVDDFGTKYNIVRLFDGTFLRTTQSIQELTASINKGTT